MNLLLLNNFDPVTSYRRVRKKRKRDESSYIGFGHSLWSAISCNVVKELTSTFRETAVPLVASNNLTKENRLARGWKVGA